MSINLTDEIEVKTKKGKLGAAKQIFLEGDTQTVEKEIQNINSRHNTLNTKHESLSRTVQGIAATGGASTATNVTYDKTNSGLNAENAQDAIDELQSSKFDKASILQESGNAEDKVMSQKATTTAITYKTTRIEEQVKEINSKRELSYDAIELIKTILSNAVFVSDQQSNIEELYKELEAGGGVVKTPVITLNGNVCTIVCKTENTTIRYTINGVSPSITIGTIYSASFSLDESCTIKTIAYTPEGNISKIVTKDYELSVDYIVFADAEVERVCLANFDSDGDGKISFEEAANVTSIGKAFNGNTTITKFHELKYFGITNISYCFVGTSSLVSVTLPSHLKTISVSAFNNSAIRFINTENIESVEQAAFSSCANLENVNLDSCRVIGYSAFEKCTNMTLHSDELTLSSLGDRAFHSCANLNLRKISGTISEIPGSAFYKCTSITELELGEIQSIGVNAFAGCSYLTEVKITGKTVPTIQSSSFPNTTVFYVPTSMVSAYANAEVWNTIYNNGRIKQIND